VQQLLSNCIALLIVVIKADPPVLASQSKWRLLLHHQIAKRFELRETVGSLENVVSWQLELNVNLVAEPV